MRSLQVDVHHRDAHTASGRAERLGFTLPWSASGHRGEWTIFLPTEPGLGREEGAFEVVTEDNWRAFERAVRHAIKSTAAHRVPMACPEEGAWL